MHYGLVFPGQGSQHVGMLAELAKYDTIVKDIFKRASDVLGFDLWRLTQTNADALNQTENTQVAMLSAGYATYKVLCNNIKDLTPSYVAGHSLGEYTALVAADYIDFEDAVALVRKRAELMQSATPKGVGAMAAIIGLTDDIVIKICASITDGVVEAVNFNSPKQVVIAGNKSSVTSACELLKKSGAKRAILLPISVPSHSSLMKDAANKFANFIDNTKMKLGKYKIIHNVNANTVSDIKEIKNNLIKQLYSSVKWTQSINYMQENSVNLLLECGPGKVLTGLAKSINKELSAVAINNSETIKNISHNIKNEK